MSDPVALAVLVVLLALNAYFVAAEFAMVAARRHHVEPAAAEGSRLARVAMRSIDDLSTSLATTQL
ncbi:CNNM domain-containing protein, partial [Dietzia sp.]|uniref:CNNM domain-containing protein n=1 Tax=Dietzia sp. TaxID=1871616 RepID=UPI002FDA67BC